MRKVKSIFAVLVVLALLNGCVALGITVKPYSEMTPKEKVTFFYTEYNKQYADYKVVASSLSLTEPQKQVLRIKKEILVKIYPMIQIADLALIEGKPFDPSIEKTIIGYLNQLGSKIK